MWKSRLFKHSLGWLLAACAILLPSMASAQVNLRFKPNTWKAPSTALGAGYSIVAEYEIENNGTANVGSFDIVFYYNDGRTTSGATSLQKITVAGLDAGKSLGLKKQTLLLPTRSIFGTRYIIARIIPAGTVKETSTSDNIVYHALTLTGLPDLRATFVGVTPPQQVPNGPLQVSYRLYNGGVTRTTTTFYTRFYLSTNNTYESTDTYLGRTITTRGLYARTYFPTSTNGTTSVTIPQGTKAGKYYLLAVVDYDDRVKNEYRNTTRDNTYARSFDVVSQKPDLVIKKFALSPTTVAGYNSKVKVTYNVQNSGTGATSGTHYISFYYSNTTTSTLTYLSRATLPSIAGGKDLGDKTIELTMPTASTYGSSRYIHYFIDYTNRVSEIRETNNKGYARIRMTGRPNLNWYRLAIVPTSQVAGGQLKVNYYLRNAGSTVAAASVLRCYYSTNNTYGNGDRQLTGEASIPSLRANQYHQGSVTLTLPTSGVTPGSRFLVCRADARNQVAESSESDNYRPVALTISRAIADLQMTAWSVPTSSPGYNNTVKIDYTINNTGNADAVASTATFYYTDTATFATTNVLGTVSVKALKAGEKVTGSLSIKLPGKVQSGKRYIHYFLDSGSKVAESNETNNQGNKSIDITGKPNFVVSILSIQPTTQIPRGQVTVTYRIENKGTTRSTATTYTRFYFSTDTTIDSSDNYLRVAYIPALDAGASYPATQNGTTVVTLPSSAKVGKAYIGAITDYGNRTVETDENDNTKAVPITIGSSIADLSMDSWSLSPASVQGAGDTITVKFKVKNGGKVDAGPFKVTFYYGTSYYTSSSNIALGTTSVTGVKAGQSSAELTASLKLPNSVIGGKRYIHFYIDSETKVAESSESNNRGYKDFQITGKPNFQITTLSISPTSQVRYGYVTVTYSMKNAGKVRSNASYMALYYSKDATIDTKDTYLTRVYVGALNAGDSFPSTGTRTISVRIPSSAVANTTAYIGAFADYLKYTAESDENDNTKSAPLKIVTTIADLSISSWSIKPTSVSGYNSAIDVDIRVRNNGTSPAQNIKVNIYYSTSNSVTTTTGLQQLGTVTIRRIDPRTTDSTQSLTNLKLPRSVVNGTGYIHAFVDPDNTISESYESNNRSVRTLTVTGLPNLQVSVLSVKPQTQGAGGQLTVTYKIYNAGLAAANGFKIGIYYSEDATIDSKDTLLSTKTIASLGAQSFEPGSGNGTATITLPKTAKPGSRTIGVFVDYEAKVKETSEQDNTKTATIQVSAPQPDLAASSISAAPNAQKTGSSVAVTVKFQNVGGADVTSYQLGIYFSKDATIDGNDTLLQNVSMGPIKSGQTGTRTVNVALPVSLPNGAGYIGFFLDNDTKVSESDEKNNTSSTAFTVYTDQDKDGVYSDKDCNDNDKTIYPGAPELCDGKDNDCNKKIDDNPKCVCKTGDVRPCFSGSSGCTKQPNGSYTCTSNSPCKAGTQKCNNGQWEATCNGEVLPAQETCNGKDDNCDGKTDENLTQNCYSGTQGTAGQGLCKEGVRTCTGGQWSTCVGEVTPSQESCDGKDNDCDGKVDNQPSSSNPLEQPCTSNCGNGVESCLQGKWDNCTAPKTCEPGPEASTEPTTDAGTTDQGTPDLDCYTQSCPSGEVCRNGQCVADPCDGVSCQADEFCRGGQCVKACGCTQCNTGESCVDGSCVNNPCAGVQCPSGEICDPLTGQCDSDPCQGIQCGNGRVCSNGNCVDDPCANVQCPLGQVCNEGQCVGQNCQGGENTGEGSTGEESTQESTDVDSGQTDESPDRTTTNDTNTTQEEDKTDTATTQDTTQVQDTSTSTDKNVTTDTTDTLDLPSVPEGGCGCQLNATTPASLLLLFSLCLLFVFRRRRRI